MEGISKTGKVCSPRSQPAGDNWLARFAACRRSPDTMSPEDREYFEERGAIREYDGNQTRADAEQGALHDLEARKHRRAGAGQ